MQYIMIVFAGILVNNYVLVQSIGICPFLGVSKKTDTAIGMGLAVTFVMTIASVVTFVIYKYFMMAFQLEYLKTIVFILVIAALVQSVEIVLKKISPTLYRALGVYLPLITTNCAVLAVAIANTTAGGYDLLSAFLNGVSAGAGFTLAIVLLSGVREKMERAFILPSFRGFPITLISAGILAMAFSAFSGIAF